MRPCRMEKAVSSQGREPGPPDSKYTDIRCKSTFWRHGVCSVTRIKVFVGSSANSGHAHATRYRSPEGGGGVRFVFGWSATVRGRRCDAQGDVGRLRSRRL